METINKLESNLIYVLSSIKSSTCVGVVEDIIKQKIIKIQGEYL